MAAGNKPLDDILRDGHTVVRGLLPAKLTAACRERIIRRAGGQGFDEWPGVNSKRIRDPLEWGGEAFTTVINATVDRLGETIETLLGPAAWLTSLQALVLLPTSWDEVSAEDELRLRQGSLHNDYPYGEFKECMDRKLSAGGPTGAGGRPIGLGHRGWQFPEGHRPGHGAPHTVQTIWVLDPFTDERGATRLLPGSHTWGLVPTCGEGRDWDLFSTGAVSMLADAGDVIVYVGATWHNIGINRGDTPRVALLGQWSPHYMTPLEPLVWMTPSWATERLSDRSKAMLGMAPYTASCGGDASRPPHHSEPTRSLWSCAVFMYDTLRHPPHHFPLATLAALLCGSAVASAAAVAGVGLLRGGGRGKSPLRFSETTAAYGHAFALISGWVVATAAGAIIGTAATLRRFNF